VKRGPRASLILLLLIPVLGVFVSCDGDNGTTTPPVEDEPAFPEDYQSAYTLVRDCRTSTTHPSNVTVHASPEAADDYMNGNYPLAEGSILVKTIHADLDCMTVDGYVVMQKGPPGTAPDSGDWIWQEVDENRKVLQSGTLQACISCHRSCTNGRDFTCTDP
jgi:hypothetical protein